MVAVPTAPRTVSPRTVERYRYAKSIDARAVVNLVDPPCDALYIPSQGDLVVTMAGEASITDETTFTEIPVGIHKLSVKRIGISAGMFVVALWE